MSTFSDSAIFTDYQNQPGMLKYAAENGEAYDAAQVSARLDVCCR